MCAFSYLLHPMDTFKNSESGVLKKDLNLFDSTLLIIGSMIGSAIFIVSSDIARMVGSPSYLLVWILSGVITLAAALSFGELAAMMPKAGSQEYLSARSLFPSPASLWMDLFFSDSNRLYCSYCGSFCKVCRSAFPKFSVQ